MKRPFDVTNKYLTAYSCMHLIALSRGLHSDKAELMVYYLVKMYSNEQMFKIVNGIMKSTFKHAQQALPGGGNMK